MRKVTCLKNIVFVFLSALSLLVSEPLANAIVLARQEPSVAIPELKDSVGTRNALSYVPGEIIVKFKEEAGLKIDSKLLPKILQLSPSQTGLASINILNTKYKVKKISPVFKELKSKHLQSGKTSKEILREDSYQFPLRLKRIPKEAIPPNLLNTYRVELKDKNADIPAICSDYQNDPNVEYAEPNYIASLLVSQGYPDDPYFWSSGSWGQDFDDQWGLKRIQAKEAWEILGGLASPEVIIAISDTGIDNGHPDLQPHLPFGNSYADLEGHGTWVAGIAGATTNNSLGIVGVAGESPVNYLIKYYSMTPQGIQQAATDGADIINCSWLSGGESLHDAVRYAYSLGVIVVVASGNDFQNEVSEFASWPEVIAVGASDRNDNRCPFSNYGSELDVVAPGADILSTLARGSNLENGAPSLIVGEGDYRYFHTSGTSGAAPFVSGLVALILSQHPDYAFQQVRSVLTASADDVGSPGFDIQTGYGRINAKKAVELGEVPLVKLISPASGEMINPQTGFVDIVGTADGPDIQHYSLSYSRASAPGVWIDINQGPINNPIVNEVLGTWIIQDLAEDIYILRLNVTVANGSEFSDVAYIDISKTRQISTSSLNTNERQPVISDNRIVWYYYNSGQTDVMMFDLLDNTERQITSDLSDQDSPYISGNNIVWQDFRNDNWDIYLYDLTTNTERQITNNTADQYYSTISGNNIVWQDFRNDNWDIYLYDLTTNTERQITNNTADQYSSAILGNNIVWQDFRNDNWDIYLYDLTTNTERQITSDLSEQGSPSILGNNIVWQDFRNGNWDIYLYDLTTNTERQITSDLSYQNYPSISGNNIVWQDSRNGNWDIYLYDLTTNTERQITNNTKDQYASDISGDHIVWNDQRNDNGDIYLYDLGELPQSSTYVCGNVGNQLWSQVNSPYVAVCNLNVPLGNALSIQPGVEVRFNNGYGLDVQGTLSARGQMNNRVIFTSNNENPQPGDWPGIILNQNSSNSIIDNSTVEYAQAGITEAYQHSPSSRISHNLIRFNSKGIYLSDGGNPEIINNDIIGNGFGIYAVNGPALVKNNIIVQNSDYGIFAVSGAGGLPIPSYNDVWQNGTNYGNVAIGAGDISQNPQFINITNDDYHLGKNSPCIDRGDPSLAHDPDNTRADIGAFYYHRTGQGVRCKKCFVEQISGN